MGGKLAARRGALRASPAPFVMRGFSAVAVPLGNDPDTDQGDPMSISTVLQLVRHRTPRAVDLPTHIASARAKEASDMTMIAITTVVLV